MQNKRLAKSNYRELPAHGQLTLFYTSWTRPHTHRLAQIKTQKETKKNFPGGPLASCVSRWHVLSLARVLRSKKTGKTTTTIQLLHQAASLLEPE